MAVPVTTLRHNKYGEELDEAADLVEEYQAIEVIIGMPLQMSGSQASSSVRFVQSWANELAELIAPVPVRLVDERMSTVTAHQALHAAGKKERDFRSVVDQAAAVVILNHALDTERTTGQPAGYELPIHGGKR